MVMNAPCGRMIPRWMCAASGVVVSVMLAVLSVTPAWAKEILLRIGDVRVPAGTIVHGDAIAAGGSTYVDGTVEGDAVALGGSVDVRGHVTGSVRAMGGNAVVRSTAVVDGSVTATGGTVIQEPGASMGGQPTMPPPAFPLPLPGPPGGAPGAAPPWWLPGVFAWLLWMLHSLFWAGHLVLVAVFVGAAWAIAVLFPHAVARVAALLERDAVMAFAAGVVTWPASAVITVALALTIVGVPLALAVPAVVIVAAQFGLAAVAFVIGKRAHPSAPVREVVVGALLLAIAFSVPGLGHLVGLAAATWGLGAVVLTLTETARFLRRPRSPLL